MFVTYIGNSLTVTVTVGMLCNHRNGGIIMANHEIERKFLIRKPSEEELFSFRRYYETEVLEIKQTYLTPGENSAERRVREITAHIGTTKFFYTEKVKITELDRMETEYEITDFSQLHGLMEQADPARTPIKKTRYAFYYKGEKFEMDIYPFSDHFAILEIEFHDGITTFPWPPLLEKIEEVTNVPGFKNGALAKAQTFPTPYNK